jgi:hypothetical protein
MGKGHEMMHIDGIISAVLRRMRGAEMNEGAIGRLTLRGMDEGPVMVLDLHQERDLATAQRVLSSVHRPS